MMTILKIFTWGFCLAACGALLASILTMLLNTPSTDIVNMARKLDYVFGACLIGYCVCLYFQYRRIARPKH
jgi:hypothetical protein